MVPSRSPEAGREWSVTRIDLQGVSLSYGGPPLLQRVDLLVEADERVCLMGRNGTGKSSLLRLVNGAEVPDDGRIERQPGLRTAMLPQEVPPAEEGTVEQLALAGVEPPPGEEEWQRRRRTERVFAGLRLDPAAPFASLSGGMKRRVFLARALISQPDLLLLDEPTNHLDIDAIAWLEEHLLRYPGAVLFVTHDRAFLGRLATRIVELDRGALTSYPGDHATYLRRKAELLAVEEAERARFDKKLAEEEAWIRQGIKARRRRNEGRVRALQQMRRERRERREQLGTARIRIQQAERSGKRVIEARGVSFAYRDGPVIVRGLDTEILRGDKVGVIGPNGIGKTTLLRILLGELAPDEGSVHHGARLDVAYLDQLRDQLRDDRTVAQNVADGADTVVFDGQARHVITYLEEFLFAAERARSPVSALSGGERNRLLLARLFARPSNVLVLDEPTNDLDTETLELLEERLAEYDGTVLLVSHDRAFLDNVVTGTLAFEGDGAVREYVGGYEDWVRQREQAPEPAPRPKKSGKPRPRPPAERPRKRTYAEQLELDALPERIEALEAERDALQAQTADPAFYRRSKDEITAALARLEAMEAELAAVYARWEQLEQLPG